jgi:hypothetical protein
MAENITPSEASDIKNGKLSDYCLGNNIEGKYLIRGFEPPSPEMFV